MSETPKLTRYTVSLRCPGGDYEAVMAEYVNGDYCLIDDAYLAIQQAREEGRKEEREKIKAWIVDIMGRNEYSQCWFVDDGGGDCGNWSTCTSECSLRQMMDFCGIVPQEDRGFDKQFIQKEKP